jgi:hypothetical protein
MVRRRGRVLWQEEGGCKRRREGREGGQGEGDAWKTGVGREVKGGRGQGRFGRISHSMTHTELAREGTSLVCRTGTSLGGLKVQHKKKDKMLM